MILYKNKVSLDGFVAKPNVNSKEAYKKIPCMNTDHI